MLATQTQRKYRNTQFFTRKVGETNYELTDHASATLSTGPSATLSTGLGNVRTTITDRKLATFNNWNITGFTADITSANDYFPFGSSMPGRSYNSGEYRYGFNGMEKDDEVKGQGNSLDFGARIYDSRIGRWLSLDPLMQAHESGYAFVADNPIIYVDRYGEDNVIYIVALPSSSSSLSKEDYQNIVQEANNAFDRLGVKTKVVLFESSAPFDPRHLDETDSYVMIGSNKEIVQTISENPDAYRDKAPTYYSEAKGYNHPEESNKRGPGVVIDSEGLAGWSRELKSDKSKATALIVLHGAGHNAGLSHVNQNNWIMKEAGRIMAVINPMDIYFGEEGGIIDIVKPEIKTVDDVMSPVNNASYKAGIEDHFGTNEPSDNYSKNKAVSDTKKISDKKYGNQKDKFDK